ncbi:MAG: leucine--tRNA ligase [Gammaproteobacteria bacterium]|nr:leucine--tRNA ligase [Gammaproteobacteria bacterium]MXW45897.1 leucine--tRNA ligase [Gammaproteobacteria bacterium]MYD00765.1 leucine--tRNA ligase [Gammaproteobacteria bacterium]MYI25447.1 leucine--tRNA ligase [Gammaproteobacteria bacterium]
MSYPFAEIEPKWQARWERDGTFRTPVRPDHSRPKAYILDMFPYPSGAGLHVGHPEGYTATDIVARYKRMRGYNVLHPIGWDAFGLPAEQYAVRTNTHPRVTTRRNIDRFRMQLKSLGFSYDWSREISTADPDYYRWTQWIFLKLHERGLAYQDEQPVWWCPELGTTLANEEVVEGRSEVGGFACERRPLRQWMLRITEYAERLLDGLDGLDWPESTLEMQRNWIGRSVGAEIDFELIGSDEKIRVFSTRPDTIFGATFLALSPEHPLVEKLATPQRIDGVRRYCREAARKSQRARAADAHDRSGVDTGVRARHPVTGEDVPVWVADYVLMGYGTGAIMGVPGEDQRDWEFALEHSLKFVRTVQPPEGYEDAAFSGEGLVINSGFLNGMRVEEAKQAAVDWLDRRGRGRARIAYRLRDWLFSRQRYWGEPFPVVFVDGVARPLPETELPLTLPDLEDFRPSGSPEGPLAKASDWLDTVDPSSGRPARRETNTMPQWAGSCWYYLRFIDPQNPGRLVDPELERYWMPVDLYIGGAEHAVLHLLYARFWHKVLYDAGLVSCDEPFRKVVHQGVILGEREYTAYRDDAGALVSAERARRVSGSQPAAWVEKDSGGELEPVAVSEDDVLKSGENFVLTADASVVLESRAHKMSKSRGNVVNPEDVLSHCGADAFRLYEMFLGPLEKSKPWSTRGVEGPHRFLNRLWSLLDRGVAEKEPAAEQMRLLHRTIAKVTEDIRTLRLNTAIAALMEMVNAAARWDELPRAVAEPLVLLVSPFAPHMGEELWELLGHAESLANAPWPEAREEWLKEETVEIAVQINGKLRASIRVAAGAERDDVLAAARGNERVAAHLAEIPILREVYVPGRVVNFVV